MKELIDQLQKEGKLTEQQAFDAIRIIKDFAKKKLPVFAGAIDKLFDKYKPKEEEDFLD
ncbi:MAG: hypothetical protein RLY11_1609 [Bacteroidota bacterium]|jgi:3-oxoacyl-(acyl-carrier-protein) synthase